MLSQNIEKIHLATLWRPEQVQDIFGGLSAATELSQVLTEIVKMDPNFEKEQFLRDCEQDFIPNILEVSLD